MDRFLQEGFRQNSRDLQRSGGRSALFWMDRRHPEEHRRHQFYQSVHTAKKSSHWSAVNIKRIGELKKLKRMEPSGLNAFNERDGKRTEQYSFEQRSDPKLPRDLEKQFKVNKKAWQYFSSQAPWYQRTSIWWVISAKKHETKMKRLNTLINDSEHGRPITSLDRKKYG